MYVLSCNDIYEMEKEVKSIYGISETILMENAGAALFNFIKKTADKNSKMLILAGPGNNGGDGFVLMRHLRVNGYNADLYYPVNDNKYNKTAQTNLNILNNLNIPLYDLSTLNNIDNYNISAKGTTLQEASRAYIQAVSKNSSTYVVGSDEAYGYNYEGIVERISAVVEDGSTYYYLILDGKPNKIFMAPYSLSNELAITREGDTVKVYYVDDSNGTVDIVSFENVAFAVQISDKQEERNELDKGTSAIKSEKK